MTANIAFIFDLLHIPYRGIRYPKLGFIQQRHWYFFPFFCRFLIILFLSPELNLSQSVTQQCSESVLQFVLLKKGEKLESVAQKRNSTNLGDDDASKYDSGSDTENNDNLMVIILFVYFTYFKIYFSQVAAKSIVNPQIEGWLKKLTTKKEWKKRYFVLKDKNLYYYATPQVCAPFPLLFSFVLTLFSLQDRKAHGVISLLNYAAKPTNLQVIKMNNRKKQGKRVENCKILLTFFTKMLLPSDQN